MKYDLNMILLSVSQTGSGTVRDVLKLETKGQLCETDARWRRDHL